MALGRVAAASAELDEMLRELLNDLVGSDVLAEVIWVGQSTDWLINSYLTLLPERDPRFRSFGQERHQSFKSCASRAHVLRDLRNWVIHGTFDPLPLHEPEEILGRPWGNWDKDPVLYCIRSRNRRGMVERRFAVSDINRLTSEIEALTVEWARLWRAMNPDAITMVRWKD